jgi:hypothetical protein
MKTFRFQGKREYVEYYTIDVQAESLEEAQQMIDYGEYEENDDHDQQFIGGSDDIKFSKEI